MIPKLFVKKFLPFAKESEKQTGIHPLATLAQAAVESGWGEVCPGNMMFGVKDTDGVNGNEQLVTTTEYSTRANLKFPVILSITPVVRNGRKMFKYKVKDYFRKYETPAGSFNDHAQLFIRQPLYKKAMAVKADPEKFVKEVAKAGYATDPNYADVLLKIISMIRPYCQN